MSNALAVIDQFETQLKAVTPQFADVLGGRMPPERLIRTIVMSVQRVPKLLECNRQSLMNAGMTFGVLALEVDGVTGQGYILPFKGVAQPVIGYKGYNTIGARAGLTITAGIYREGDDFDFMNGSEPFVHHKPKLGNQGRILAAWAVAAAKDRPPVIQVLGIDDLLAIRAKSPGSKMSDSPWNDERIGFPAMCEKSARRRLARSTPMNWAAPEFQYAAVMEEAFEERGRPSYIAPGKGVIIDGEPSSPLPSRDAGTPEAEDLVGPADAPEIKALKEEGLGAAEMGSEVVGKWWGRLSPRQRAQMEAWKNTVLKPKAIAADAAKGGSDA